MNSGIYNKGEVNLEDLYKSIKLHPKIKEVGSIITFTGIVRQTSKNKKLIKSMKIDAYDEIANKKINNICSDITSLRGIIDAKIIHLKGEFEISEDLVFVIVLSTHRKEGFKALKRAVERYKKEITVWKKEFYLDGSSEWIH